MSARRGSARLRGLLPLTLPPCPPAGSASSGSRPPGPSRLRPRRRRRRSPHRAAPSSWRWPPAPRQVSGGPRGTALPGAAGGDRPLTADARRPPDEEEEAEVGWQEKLFSQVGVWRLFLLAVPTDGSPVSGRAGPQQGDSFQADLESDEFSP